MTFLFQLASAVLLQSWMQGGLAVRNVYNIYNRIHFWLKMLCLALLCSFDYRTARIGYPSVNYAKHAEGSQGRIGLYNLELVTFVLFVLEAEP